MKREFLKGLNLEDKVIDQIMSVNGSNIRKCKVKLSRVLILSYSMYQAGKLQIKKIKCIQLLLMNIWSHITQLLVGINEIKEASNLFYA